MNLLTLQDPLILFFSFLHLLLLLQNLNLMSLMVDASVYPFDIFNKSFQIYKTKLFEQVIYWTQYAMYPNCYVASTRFKLIVEHNLIFKTLHVNWTCLWHTILATNNILRWPVVIMPGGVQLNLKTFSFILFLNEKYSR